MPVTTVGPRPGDQRGFVHKRLLGAVGGFLTGGPAGAVGGFLKPPPRARRHPVPPVLALPGPSPLSIINLPCIPPAHRDPVTRRCILGERPGRDLPGDRPIGESVMGQYGAALVPGSMPVDRAVCPRGAVLANDGLCYNKSQISNKQRMWPAGRKPLLTGGDLRAISVAARAGRRMELATKRLQKMGMMKKPTRRTRVPAGHRARLVHQTEH